MSIDWAAIHAERQRVADLLAELGPEQWETQSLCTEWSVEMTTAHLTAAASTGTLAWMWNMASVGFNAGKHNLKLLRRYLGPTLADTLANYRGVVGNTIAPTKDGAAWLGEVIVHGQDIARVVGVDMRPDPAAVLTVAEFFASRDFAVNSKSQISGLQLIATDSSFTSGTGPLVRGTTLELVMSMAGRPIFAENLEGAGADELRQRLAG